MSKPLNLPALKALCDAASPGPWEWTEDKGKNRGGWSDDLIDGKYCTLFSGDCEVISSCDGCRNLGENENDMQFIAAARTALPQLIEEVKRLTAWQKNAIEQLTVLETALHAEMVKRWERQQENTAIKAELAEWQQQAVTSAEVIHRLSGRTENSKAEIENQALRELLEEARNFVAYGLAYSPSRSKAAQGVIERIDAALKKL